MSDHNHDPAPRLKAIKVPGKDAHSIWQGERHVGMVFANPAEARQFEAFITQEGEQVRSPPYGSVALTLAWCDGYLAGRWGEE